MASHSVRRERMNYYTMLLLCLEHTWLIRNKTRMGEKIDYWEAIGRNIQSIAANCYRAAERNTKILCPVLQCLVPTPKGLD